MTYDELKRNYDDCLTIEEMSLSDVNGLKGLYIDNCIAIEKKMNSAEKACILAEELGHHFTTAGDILDLTDIRCRKQEQIARLWAYNKQIGLTGIINAYKADCKNRYDMAEYLGVTEPFLAEALDCYRSKYGTCVIVDNYIVYFEPSLGVMEKL